jgi:GntR family transcriptional regulator, transcriptional repressor for pyruvate dehydrogenase complex
MSHLERVAQITAQLERSIRSGELAPGDRLPSERQFSARFGVSRGVIREALGCLAGQGLVKSYRGSGTRVTPPDSRLVTAGLSRLIGQMDHRLEDLCAVRLVIEPAIAAMAAIHRAEEHLDRMEKTQAIFRNPRRSLETYVQADMVFHASLADASGNPIFVIILEPIRELLRESLRQTMRHCALQFISEPHGKVLDAVRARAPERTLSALRQQISEPHGKILDAVRARDPERASSAMRQHMEITVADIAEIRHSADRARRAL